jgi:DNA adenine methylase
MTGIDYVDAGVLRRLTPLRYPGGKAQLGSFFAGVVAANNLSDGVYVEPFAGGAGVAIALLLGDFVDTVFINDIDPAVYAFWTAVVELNSDLVELVRSTPITVTEWERQRDVYRGGEKSDPLALGFAMFYLNRTNRSGIMNGGVIGGREQNGPWKIDARFNRAELARRIQRIGRYRSRIMVTCTDAYKLLKELERNLPKRALVYLDPPYYDKGQHLYTNYYRHEDHLLIADAVGALDRPWVVSYDDHPAIRKMYTGFPQAEYSLGYAAREARRGAEIMFFARGLKLPVAGLANEHRPLGRLKFQVKSSGFHGLAPRD